MHETEGGLQRADFQIEVPKKFGPLEKGGEVMFEHILYPTDCSDVAMKAIKYIRQLREAGTKEVTILHIIDKRLLYETAQDVNIDFEGLEKQQIENITTKCSRFMEDLKEAGLIVKLRTEKGNPYQEILKVARDEDISLIVIGSHGRSNVEEMMLGSVSEAVIRHAVQPVLVIKR